MRGRKRPMFGSFLAPRSSWLLGVILVLAIFLAYGRVWHAGFIWDDDAHLTENPCIVGSLGFKGIWTTTSAVYYPLVLSSFWLQHAIWGLNPLPYHLVNIAVHGACAVLLWQVLRSFRMTGAWLAAALWSLHPVQVESVAWITELKNTQSCLFYLLSILFFLKWRETTLATEDARGNSWNYFAALLCAIAAILSKSSTVMLPIVLALCWWWTDGRWSWQNVVRLIPFLLVSAIAAAWTIWEQKFHSGAIGIYWAETWPQRIIIAGRVVWFYLGKLLWPHSLTFVYPRWKIDASQPWMYLPVLAASAALFVLWLNRNGQLRPAFFAVAYFIVSLFPVLGLFNVYYFRYSFVGDHFQYLASMGPLALVAAGISALSQRNLFIKPVVYSSLLFLLSMLTWRQCTMYTSAEKLWRITIARDPASLIAYDNLGVILLQTGRNDEALNNFKRAVEINPESFESHNNLGNALLIRGETDESIAQLQMALRFNPNYAPAHNNLGLALEQTGRLDDAIAQYQLALRTLPNDSRVHCNLGTALLHRGKIDDAVVHLEIAIDLRSDDAKAQSSLGIALLQLGRIDEAVVHLEKSLQLNPNSAEAQSNLGLAFSQIGRLKDSVDHLEKALEANPDDGAVHYNLAATLLKIGRIGQAIAHLQKTLEIDPADVEAANNLAWTLATCPQAELRDGRKAVEFAERASQLTEGRNARISATLAAAYAETGRFADAVRTAENALQLASASGATALADGIRAQLALYRVNQPMRDHNQSFDRTPVPDR